MPIASPSARAVATVASLVSMPGITSTSRISGAGLKKCIPTTFAGSDAALAMNVTGIDEVFVAITASEPQIAERSWKSSRFSSSRSGAASITKSQPSSPSSAAAVCRRVAAASASSLLQRPRSAPFARFARVFSIPAASASATGSCTRVSTPASAPSCAIPAPIVPAPTTPRRRGRPTAQVIAFTPVAARPMISFWICEVPSYRVVTRASRR